MGCKTCGGYKIMDSLAKAAKDIITGNRVNSIERKMRFQICAGGGGNKRCKKFIEKTGTGRHNVCKICRCWLKNKVMFKNQYCPAYKWIRKSLIKEGFKETIKGGDVVILDRKSEQITIEINRMRFVHKKDGNIVKEINKNKDLYIYIDKIINKAINENKVKK